MRADVARDLSDSAAEFERVVAPAILPHIGGGELISSESVSASGFHKDLDVLAGIDGWHLIRGKHLMRGVASRVQWGKNWRTFSIRLSRQTGTSTELEKRYRAITDCGKGYLYPHLTIQAYIDSPKGFGELRGAAVARTDQLIVLANDLSRDRRYIRRNPADGSMFVVVEWDLMVDRGLLLVEIGG